MNWPQILQNVIAGLMVIAIVGAVAAILRVGTIESDLKRVERDLKEMSCLVEISLVGGDSAPCRAMVAILRADDISGFGSHANDDEAMMAALREGVEQLRPLLTATPDERRVIEQVWPEHELSKIIGIASKLDSPTEPRPVPPV